MSEIVERIAGTNARSALRSIKERLFYFWHCQAVKPRLLLYHALALRTTRFGTTGRCHSPEVIVSFTSYPARVRLKGVVEGTALSLLRQSVKPDRLILWLSRRDFPNGLKDVPKGLVALLRCGLEIMFCDEMKSYKKLIPTLLNWPDATVVTADDDVYYPNRWLEDLLLAHREHPRDVIAYLGRRIASSKGCLDKYENWQVGGFIGCTQLNLQTGVGGVLYPSGAWDDRILDYKLAQKLAPLGDDLFFHLFCVMNGTLIRAIKLSSPIIDLIPNTNVAPHLCSENLGQAKNDIAIQTICKEYPQYLKRLLEVGECC